MESTENNAQEPSKSVKSAAQQEAQVLTEKAKQTQGSAEAKAAETKDSIVNDLKAKGETVLQKVKALPGAPKAKLFVGVGLVFASLLSYVAVFHFASKALFLLAGVFYPIIVAAITILSAYNQNDFFEALFAKKGNKKNVVEHPEIHHEDDIHETHEHPEEKTDA